MSRGHEPAKNPVPANIAVPQLKQMTPTPNSPTVEQSPTVVRGRGKEDPVARPDGVQGPTGTRPSGITVEESPARVRGRGADQPKA